MRSVMVSKGTLCYSPRVYGTLVIHFWWSWAYHFDLGSYQSEVANLLTETTFLSDISEFICLIHARLLFYSSHPVVFDSSFYWWSLLIISWYDSCQRQPWIPWRDTSYERPPVREGFIFHMEAPEEVYTQCHKGADIHTCISNTPRCVQSIVLVGLSLAHNHHCCNSSA